MSLILICVTILCTLFISTWARITVPLDQYASMPDLFYLDKYDRCMMVYDEDALYCLITFQLYPEDVSNKSETWKIIEKISSEPSNYRHDKLRHGVCLQQSCPDVQGLLLTHKDQTAIRKIITNCYNQKYEELGIKGEVTQMHCQHQEASYQIDEYDIAFAFFLIFYCLLVVYASFYEGLARYESPEEYKHKTQTKYGTFISAFSIPKNWQRLRTISIDGNAKSLQCIQGVRFFNMICVIFAHTIMCYFGGLVSNPIFTETMTEVFFNALISNGAYVVQTFFLISGWLLVYNIYENLENNKTEISVGYLIKVFFFRYVRLTPILALIIAFHATWLVKLSRGPFWDKIVGDEYRYCRENWWTNLLYINNFVNEDRMCAQHSWYLATDLQLFLLSLIIIYLMKKYENYVKYILGGIITIGILIPMIVSYIHEFDILIRSYPENLYEFDMKLPEWQIMYAKSYTNITGYMLGIMFGYIYYQTRKQNFFTSKVRVTLWWILVLVPSISVVLVAGFMYQENFTFTKIEAALFWGFGRNIFAFSMGLLIFGMTQKIGWFIRWCCEYPPLIILGRLTYSAYVIHVALIKFRVGLNQELAYVSNYLLIQTGLGDVTMSFLVATILVILFELPVSALQKVLFSAQIDKKN